MPGYTIAMLSDVPDLLGDYPGEMRMLTGYLAQPDDAYLLKDGRVTVADLLPDNPLGLLGQVPIDVRLREGGDNGMPLVLSDPDAPAAKELRRVAEQLGTRSRGLAGRSLGLSPA